MPRSSRTAIVTSTAAVQRLAKWSADCRTILGLSQDKVGKGAGISQGGVSRIESGKNLSIPLVSYLCLVRFYASAAARAGLALDDPGMLLRRPEALGMEAVSPTRSALLRILNDATPRQRQTLLEIAHVLLRRHNPDEVPHEDVQ